MTTDKKSTSKNIRLEDFIDENRNEALAIDISNSHPKVWEILQEQKDKLENAEFDSEREEVQQFAKNCIKRIKTRLQFHLRNNYKKITYKNMTPPYLMEIRLLLEYRGLINSDDKPNTKFKKQNKVGNKYSLKEIKIAYFCLGITITADNYLKILKKHSNSKSDKILQKQIVKSVDLTSVSENKTADTKHLNSLKNAKRLLSGIKNEDALRNIDQYTSTFEANYQNCYQ